MTLEQGIKEFIIAGKLSEERSLFISAADNYFKALVHAVDFFIYKNIGKIPDNHAERFRILESFNKEIYQIVDSLFKLYVKSYRDVIKKEELGEIKNGLKRILKITGLEKEFVKYL